MVNLISNLLIFPLILRVFNFRYSGIQKISRKENYIFAMNHQSGLDLFFALSLLVPYTKRHLSIVLDSRFYDFPLLKPIFKRWQAIRVNILDNNERKKAILEAKKCLDKGNNVLIFPEGDIIGGTIGEPIRAFTGVTQLALLSKKKIIPIGIKGSYGAWKFPASPAVRLCKSDIKEKIKYKPKSKVIWISDLFNFFEFNFKHPVKMVFGKEIDLSKKYSIDLNMFSDQTKKTLRCLTTNIMKQIAQLAGQKYKHDC